MNVNVVSEDVHAEELASADLTGVLLIAVSQQMLVHVAPAGEHLCTQNPVRVQRLGQMSFMISEPPPLICAAVRRTHLATDGTG